MGAELDAVADLARAAGELALRHYRRVTASRKADESFVTLADRDVERLIRGELARIFPADAIVGEESGRSGPLGAERIWYIDPIDGTTNYVHGIPLWCVAIGLLQAGRLRLGVLYDPIHDELYRGKLGEGAWLGERPLVPWQGREPLSRTDPVVFPTNLCDGAPDLGPVRWRLLGSAQLHFAVVARGAARAGLWTQNYAWDLVAGAAICEAAGCLITHLDGSAVDWSTVDAAYHWNLLVAPPDSHQIVLAQMRSTR